MRVCWSCPATCGHEGVSAAIKDLLLAVMKSLNSKRVHWGPLGRAREVCWSFCLVQLHLDMRVPRLLSKISTGSDEVF